jgi:hypothetical protein
MYLRNVLFAFAEKPPRLASGLYQVVLCLLTFWCAVAISSYEPTPAINDPTGRPPNRTVERKCPSDVVCSSRESFIVNNIHENVLTEKFSTLSLTLYSAPRRQPSSQRSSSS